MHVSTVFQSTPFINASKDGSWTVSVATRISIVDCWLSWKPSLALSRSWGRSLRWQWNRPHNVGDAEQHPDPKLRPGERRKPKLGRVCKHQHMPRVSSPGQWVWNTKFQRQWPPEGLAATESSCSYAESQHSIPAAWGQGWTSALGLNQPCKCFRPTTPVWTGLHKALFFSRFTYMPLISPHSDSCCLHSDVRLSLEIPLKSSTALNIGESFTAIQKINSTQTTVSFFPALMKNYVVFYCNVPYFTQRILLPELIFGINIWNVSYRAI